jgi:DNA (cytosine-5)-methyltransferase 1
MWLAGRYVGDGWTRLTDNRAELVITCGDHESTGLSSKLEEMWPRLGSRAGKDELAWHGRRTATAYQVSTNHRGLVEWLRKHFGHGAQSKHVPMWLLGLPNRMKSAFLNGYLSADGHRCSTFWECMTVSKALAFGVKAVANSLGRTVGIYYYSTNTTRIEGREVAARPYWKLRWRDEVEINHQQTRRDEDGREWCPIRENSDAEIADTVFNIGVEEDESYIVEGIIVHNCKHFSRAKGGKPVEKHIRGLAWVAVKWAKKVRPRIIILENVREFKDWGPLTLDNRPCIARKGLTFRRFIGTLRNLGYEVDHRELNAADYGAPTHRRRFFMIARRDGLPINWPEPTHGPGRRPYRTAAECIDWTIRCPSIFLTKPEAKVLGVIRPLAEKTQRRIAMGLKRYVIDNPKPFIVRVDHGGEHFRGQPIDKPLSTVTGSHGHAVVTPFVAGCGGRAGQSPATAGDAPIGTITAKNDRVIVAPYITKICQHGSNSDRTSDIQEPLRTLVSKNEDLVVTPFLAHRYGEAPHQQTRGQKVDEPIRTVTPDANTGMLIAPTMIQYNGEKGGEARGQSLEDPINTIPTENRFGVVAPVIVGSGGPGYSGKPRPVDQPAATVMTENHSAIVAAFLAKHYGGVLGHGPERPLGTITAVDHHSVVAANLLKFRGNSKGSSADAPMPTITAGGDMKRPAGAAHAMGIATSNLVKLRGECTGSGVDEPTPTITAGGNHIAEVRAFLMKFYSSGSQGQVLDVPLHTITAQDRFGIVTVEGQEFQIIDIGMRMLEPRELLNAQFGKYAKGYILQGPKWLQVKMIGNSVPPQLAEALVRANFTSKVEAVA